MGLKPLTKTDDVPPPEFRQLFEARLGHLFPAALQVLNTLGPMHSFSVANCIHLGLQKGNIDDVVRALAKWCEVVRNAPNRITADVDTKQFFDILYGEMFMGPEDTIGGLGFEEVERRGDMRMLALRSDGPKLWTPPTR